LCPRGKRKDGDLFIQLEKLTSVQLPPSREEEKGRKRRRSFIIESQVAGKKKKLFAWGEGKERKGEGEHFPRGKKGVAALSHARERKGICRGNSTFSPSEKGKKKEKGKGSDYPVEELGKGKKDWPGISMGTRPHT